MFNRSKSPEYPSLPPESSEKSHPFLACVIGLALISSATVEVVESVQVDHAAAQIDHHPEMFMSYLGRREIIIDSQTSSSTSSK